MAIKNVVVVGGSGNLGPALVKELAAAGLNVTVTSRKESTSATPEGAKVARTDYSETELVEIFKGQDVVISTLGGAHIGQQKVLIDAAIKAGVKRYLPSEFGTDTTNEEAIKDLPMFTAKINMTKYVQQHEDKLSWTSVITGPFFDFCLKIGFLDLDLKEKKAFIWDGGNARISVTNLATIGKAVAAIISKPEAFEATKNKYVAIASYTTSQNEILSILEDLSGTKWETTPKNSQEEVRKAKESMVQGNQFAVYDLIKAHSFGAGGHGDSTKLPYGIWNDRLGLEKEDLRADLKKALDEVGA